jgi:hypothetical protein
MPDVVNGRRLVLAGQYDQPTMTACNDVIAYLQEQRGRVERTGRCEGNCHKQIKHFRTGKTVCPHTLEACPAARLALLIEAYERINAPHDQP